LGSRRYPKGRVQQYGVNFFLPRPAVLRAHSAALMALRKGGWGKTTFRLESPTVAGCAGKRGHRECFSGGVVLARVAVGP